MPIKLNNYIVLDFETTDKLPEICQPLQIACEVYNSRSLEPIPGSKFAEYCKPTCEINPDVWQITKIDPKVVEAAPSIEVVWPKFVEHVLKYNPGKNEWDAPIPVAHNGKSFDFIIARKMQEKFGKKAKKPVLFHKFLYVDTIDLVYPLFENTNELESYSLENLRKFFGISNVGAHTADKDVSDTGAIFTRVLKFYREIGKAYMGKMKGCFKKKAEITPSMCGEGSPFVA